MKNTAYLFETDITTEHFIMKVPVRAVYVDHFRISSQEIKRYCKQNKKPIMDVKRELARVGVLFKHGEKFYYGTDFSKLVQLKDTREVKDER